MLLFREFRIAIYIVYGMVMLPLSFNINLRLIIIHEIFEIIIQIFSVAADALVFDICGTVEHIL